MSIPYIDVTIPISSGNNLNCDSILKPTSGSVGTLTLWTFETMCACFKYSIASFFSYCDPLDTFETMNLLFSLARKVGIKSKTFWILDTKEGLKTGLPFLSFLLPKSVFISNIVLFNTLYAETMLLVLIYSKTTLGNPPIHAYFKNMFLYILLMLSGIAFFV